MEYCGAGSVSDIMRLRKKTLSADQVAPIIRLVAEWFAFPKCNMLVVDSMLNQ